MKLKKIGKDKWYLEHNNVAIEVEIDKTPLFFGSELKRMPVYRYGSARLWVDEGAFKLEGVDAYDHHTWGRFRLMTHRQIRRDGDDVVNYIFENVAFFYKQWANGRWTPESTKHVSLASSTMRQCLGNYRFFVSNSDHPELLQSLNEMIDFLRGK